MLREDATEGTVVTSVKAVDPDSDNYGTQGIRYTDLRGTFADK